MKIAQIAPLYEAVPPRLYGGTERVVAYLCDALVDLGYDVTLFAAAEACTKAKLVPTRDQALRLDPTPLKADIAAHLTMIREVQRRADEFDLLHFHTDLLHFPFFDDRQSSVLTTLHGRLDYPDLAIFYRQWGSFPLISISYSQRRPLPFANWLANIYHGLPLDLLSFQPRPRNYLAFLGRVSEEKRLDRAIRIAQGAGMRLKIGAKIDPCDLPYFNEVLRPMLKDPLIDFVGEIGNDEKSAFLGGAKALLFPIDWPEPFGLVMAEAMACGTPVIAWPSGSVPEIIEDGSTGFIVQSEAEAIRCLKKIDGLNRQHIRRIFERRFSARRMAQQYVDVYRQLSQRPLPQPSLQAG